MGTKKESQPNWIAPVRKQIDKRVPVPIPGGAQKGFKLLSTGAKAERALFHAPLDQIGNPGAPIIITIIAMMAGMAPGTDLNLPHPVFIEIESKSCRIDTKDIILFRNPPPKRIDLIGSTQGGKPLPRLPSQKR